MKLQFAVYSKFVIIESRMNKKINTIKQIVKKELLSSSHDLEHTFRVFELACMLAKKEQAVDMEIVEIASLLHDIARVKEDSDLSGNIDHALLGAEMAEKILRNLDYPERVVQSVKHCIQTHRYRGEVLPETKEAQILFDADKLDAIGAVGIARAYMIAGERGESIYIDIDLNSYMTENLLDGKINGRIKDISKHAPNIELETKFRYIPERLFTDTAKKIAAKRIAFMEDFFSILKKEINGSL